MLRLAHSRITSPGEVPGTHEAFQHTKYTPSVDNAVVLHVTVYECPCFPNCVYPCPYPSDLCVCTSPIANKDSVNGGRGWSITVM